MQVLKLQPSSVSHALVISVWRETLAYRYHGLQDHIDLTTTAEDSLEIPDGHMRGSLVNIQHGTGLRVS